jgi:glutamyl-tRNA reductase
MYSNALVQPQMTDEADRIIALTGLNHRVARVEVRERMAINEVLAQEVLSDLTSLDEIDEAVVLSTCNRTEVITTSRGLENGSLRSHIEGVFEQVSGMAPREFTSSLYCYQDSEAVGHLFRVAAGLDSMILGEPQVLGQLKAAYRVARDAGTTNGTLNRLFDRAFGVAKAVRTKTGIGRNAVSVCYAAKELAHQIFGSLEGARVMLIGAGDTGTLALKHFQRAGASQFLVVNKTLSKAAELAELVGGAALDLNSFQPLLSQADIIIGAATLGQDSSPLISSVDIQRAVRERVGQPQFLIDLGVPRNFDADIDGVADAFLYNVDDLEAVVAENICARQMETQRAELIVSEEVQKFLRWLERRTVEPAIREVLDIAQGYEDREVEKTIRRLKSIGIAESQIPLVEDAIRDFSHALLAKVLHEPISTLKRQGVEDRSAVDSFREYFTPRDERRNKKIKGR